MSPFVDEFLTCLSKMSDQDDLTDRCARQTSIDWARQITRRLVAQCPNADAHAFVTQLVASLASPIDEPRSPALLPCNDQLQESIMDVLRGLTFCLYLLHHGRPEGARAYIALRVIPLLRRS